MEFTVGDQPYGINALKIKEVLPFTPDQLTSIPQAHPSLLGTYLFRNETIPVINLSKELGKRALVYGTRTVLLVAEFNKNLSGFVIDRAERIHRLSWKDIIPPPKLFQTKETPITAIAHLDAKEVLILDLEFLISQIFPDTALDPKGIDKRPEIKKKREQVNIVIAEDSNLIRQTMIKILNNSGYSAITAFPDGALAKETILTWADKGQIKQMVDLIITDIEMPQLDGLTLCKHIKEHPLTKKIPVIIFSSLINDQIALKCHEVGADGYMTKPQINDLVEMVDNFMFE